MDSGSSSPDPLGQPDLSSPSLLAPSTRSRRLRGISRSKDTTKILSISSQHPRTPSPEPLPFELDLPLHISERKLLSPWRPQVSARVGRAQEMDQDDDARSRSSSPDQRSRKDINTTTTTVPLKTGDETPKKRRKRKSLTPRRRKNTSIARRAREAEILEQGEDGDEDEELQRSPTPERRRPGRPRNSDRLDNGEVATSSFSRLLSRPSDAAVVPGASPNKRRKIFTGDDIVDVTDFTSNARSETHNSFRGQRSLEPKVSNEVPSHIRPVTVFAAMTQSAPAVRDPTDEHREFDSILESEDFTMVSLSSIPSGQQLRSLTRGGKAPAPNTDGPAQNSPRRSPRDHQHKATVESATVVEVQSPDVVSSQAPQSPNTPYSNGLLAGFSPATRRELRAGLRLGQEIARRAVQAKQAAIPDEDQTGDVFTEIAAAESSNLSTSSSGSRMDRRYPASDQLLRPLGGPVVSPRPSQLPSPEQSDEQDIANERGNEMSWRFDTPAKARLNLARAKASPARSVPTVGKGQLELSQQKTPDRNGISLDLNMDGTATAESSPDKQLFLEQAAAELESSRLRPGPKSAIRLSSGSNPYLDDSSSDDEPPELSEATKSFLAEATVDIWQTEAESSKISRVSRNETQRSSSPHLEPQNDNRREEMAGQSSIEQDPDIIMIDSDNSNVNEEENEDLEATGGDEEADESVGSDGSMSSSEHAENNSLDRPPEGAQDPADEGDESEELEVDDEAETVNLRAQERLQRTVEMPQSPRSSPPGASGEPQQPERQLPAPKEKTIFDEELLPPRRGKLLSLWRRQSDDPVVYSDEIELPPAEDTTTLRNLGKRQKTFVTPEARKRARYSDADFSVPSEFKGPSIQIGLPAEREAGSSPLKRVRFESEDPENPYLPTTPVLPTIPQIYEDIEEEDEEDEEEQEDSTPPTQIKWEDKQPTPPQQQGSWLSGLLPSWFHAPREPIFRFSLPNLPQLRSKARSSGGSNESRDDSSRGEASQTASSSRQREPGSVSVLDLGSTPEPQAPPPVTTTTAATATDSYEPRAPDASFTAADYAVLKRLYAAAKARSFAVPRSDARVMRLLGWEIRKLGWAKRVSRWELGIVAAFLRERRARDARPYADLLEPRQVARRLFSIWAVEVQRGEAGLGAATAGKFSSRYAAGREAVLEKARRRGSLAVGQRLG